MRDVRKDEMMVIRQSNAISFLLKQQALHYTLLLFVDCVLQVKMEKAKAKLAESNSILFDFFFCGHFICWL